MYSILPQAQTNSSVRSLHKKHKSETEIKAQRRTKFKLISSQFKESLVKIGCVNHLLQYFSTVDIYSRVLLQRCSKEQSEHSSQEEGVCASVRGHAAFLWKHTPVKNTTKCSELWNISHNTQTHTCRSWLVWAWHLWCALGFMESLLYHYGIIQYSLSGP